MSSGQKCAECSADVKTIVARHNAFRGNLLPILHDVQAKFGFLPEHAMQEVADGLDIPVSEVYGTATFYTLFSTSRRGQYVVRVCDSAPCHIEGSKAIIKAITDELGIKNGETTEDGKFTLEHVSCFGVCGVAPAIMVNDEVHGNLTPEMIPGILGSYAEKEA
ncbi:MAG: NADH-quinone oxidoreductase subunit NuoE [Armatimonadetes bacterium]|nr:NADH-quinone oxidoreductase subunit NuoE [Armatimonadota bacterium]